MDGQAAAAHYDSLPRWGKTLDAANQERVERTLELIPEGVQTILDLGCGDGAISRSLPGRGFGVVGLDISIEALRHFPGQGLVGSLDHLPFPDRSFDLVICAEVLEHLPPGVFEAARREIARVAGRYVIVTTPNQEYLPAAFARCPSCGCCFHINLHLRALDRDTHRTLFHELAWVRTVGIGSWKHFPFLVSLEHRLCGAFRFRQGLTCPCCGRQATDKPRLGLARQVLLKALRLGQRILPGRKARWIASLYRAPRTPADVEP